MQQPIHGPRVFKKEVFQTRPYTERVNGLGPKVADAIVQATALYYPRFRRLEHGLVVGRVVVDAPPGYNGPAVEFLYRVLAHKVCFIWLKVDGFSQAELDAFEASYAR